MKKWLEEVGGKIRSNLTEWILGILGSLLLALWPVVKWRVLHLELSDTQLSAIQDSFLVFGTGMILAVGWALFFRTRRKLRIQENELMSSFKKEHEAAQKTIAELSAKNEKLSRNPRLETFLEDYDMRQGNAVFFHKKNGMPYCPRCTLQGKIAPAQYLQTYWKCRLCGEDFYTPESIAANAAKMSNRIRNLPGLPPQDIGPAMFS